MIKDIIIRAKKGPPPDYTPDQFDFGSVFADSLYPLFLKVTQQITGMDQTIYFKLSYDDEVNIYYRVDNDDPGVGSIGGAPSNLGMTYIANQDGFAVAPNQYVSFGVEYRAQYITSTITIDTFKDLLLFDSIGVSDTFDAIVCNGCF